MFEVVLYSLSGGIISLIGGLLLVQNKKSAQALAVYATPFAAGVLLAAAFTDLLPEALHVSDSEARTVLTWGLIGVLTFFMLERFLRFFHHHHDHGKDRSSSALIVIGDTLHNALDGIAIGAAFLIDVPTGIVATLAVAAHEIPQEIGDFGLLLKNGMDKKKVVIVNVASALATTLTAVLTYTIGDNENFPLSALLALTAGFFIYIAASDIIPEIHEDIKNNKKKTDVRPWLLILGAVFIMIVSPIAHDYIDAGHDRDSDSSHLHSDSEEKHSEDEHGHEEHKEEDHKDEADHHEADHHEEEGHEDKNTAQ